MSTTRTHAALRAIAFKKWAQVPRGKRDSQEDARRFYGVSAGCAWGTAHPGAARPTNPCSRACIATTVGIGARNIRWFRISFGAGISRGQAGEATTRIHELLKQNARQLGVTLEDASIPGQFTQLILEAESRFGQRAAILVDEYNPYDLLLFFDCHEFRPYTPTNTARSSSPFI